MKYTLQVFSGPWHAAGEAPEKTVRRIGEICSRIPVERVIVGWRTDPAFYRMLGSRLRRAGIEMLLWLPVFTVGDIYEKYFASCGFDGVFLDRIRGQSFAAGVPGVLSCGCERCREAYRKKGVDTDAVWKQYEKLKDSFFDIASYPMNGQFILKDPQAQRFFEAREEIVAEAAGELCRYFKEKGLTVGLDLFAPYVSRLAGQNYQLTSRHADFVKPMLYRRTEAPAGIGYEYELFGRYAPGARGRSGLTMDRAFLNTQLEALFGLPCRVCPGIEVNYSPEEVRTDADYVTESLAAVRDHGFESAVLSWDIPEAPDAHIEAVAVLERGH